MSTHIENYGIEPAKHFELWDEKQQAEWDAWYKKEQEKYERLPVCKCCGKKILEPYAFRFESGTDEIWYHEDCISDDHYVDVSDYC